MGYLNGGVFRSTDPWIHGERCIDSNELIYVIDGTVFLEEDGVCYTLSRGDILVLEGGKRHRGTAPSVGVEFYWFHFNGPFPVKLLHAADSRFSVLIRQLFHYENNPTFPRRTLELMLELIFIELKVAREDSGPGALAGEIAEWIRINSDRRITVSEISERFKYNPDYLSRLMKARFGVPLEKYIKQRRVDYVKKTLLSTEKNINEVALQCGFENYQAFLKFFTYHEGISPGEYRSLYYGVHMNKR